METEEIIKTEDKKINTGKPFKMKEDSYNLIREIQKILEKKIGFTLTLSQIVDKCIINFYNELKKGDNLNG